MDMRIVCCTQNMTGGEGIEDKEEYNGYENCMLYTEYDWWGRDRGQGRVQWI